MAREVVQGRKVSLRAELDGDMVHFACSTGLELYYDTELIERATVGMAGHRSFTYGFSEWGISYSGLSVIVPTTPMLTVFHTILEQMRKNGVNTETIFEDDAGNIKTVKGHCMIPSTRISAVEGGFSSDSIEFKGNGVPDFGSALISPNPQILINVLQINYTSSAGGEDSLTYPATINKNIISVKIDGIELELITVGDPGPKQVKYISASGTFIFHQPLKVQGWVNIKYY